MKSLEAFHSNKLKGLTYLETILVVSIVIIMSVFLIPIGSRLLQNVKTSATETLVISSLRKAQFYAINNKENKAWGVCLTSNKIRIYTDDCESPTNNEDYTLVETAEIAGLEDIVFSRLTGEPNAEAQINLTTGINQELRITLNKIGGINVERF
jgi:Tfp pilus assembly protein FimT